MAMAISPLSSSRALLLILLVAVMPVPSATELQRVSITGTVAECYPVPVPSNATLFGASVLSLLASLPSAAAPTGFASLRSGGAFARGLCFGEATLPACHQCLSLAATSLTSSCGANTHRRAGIWTDGCFASYADANATTASEDAQRPRVISVPADARARNATALDLQQLGAVAQFLAPRAAASDGMLAVADTPGVAWDYATRSNVRVLAQCARDRTAAECDRCLEYSARVAAACCWGLDPWRDGVAAAVVGFNCYLRFDVSTVPVPLRQRIGMVANDHLTLTVVLGALVVVLVVGGVVRLVQKMYYCWMVRKIRAANNARNVAARSAAAAAAGPQVRVELVRVVRAQA
uniref:Uncharacterized protein n=1 Tax=Avena sativa TaxID=4498 RepID=A0ACD5WPK8_AVESA